MNAVEMCAGAGGQALGLEMAGFEHASLVEIDGDACVTLRINRPDWRVFRQDLNDFDGRPYRGVELLAGGLPCPPFSRAGKQLGENDERNLFPAALRILDEIKPEALMIENVKGLLDPAFEAYRQVIEASVEKMGYNFTWKLINASEFGVCQLRPRVVLVAMRSRFFDAFSWPTPHLISPPTVGTLLRDLMKENEWCGADDWAAAANSIAPTIVGGSKKHGGPDLGPTRAKNAWLKLGVNGKLVAKEAPAKDFVGMPYLTVRMVARIQGFPDSWMFAGTKTNAYRQVGNAFPPPVAQAVANQIKLALELARPKVILA
jgi:DNA (cytosine-5)-methyltransferase 1